MGVQRSPEEGSMQMMPQHADGIEGAAEDGQVENPLIDKASLLQWMSDVLELDDDTKIDDFHDLRNGALFVRLFSFTLPAAVDLKKVAWFPQPVTEEEIDANYDVLDACIHNMQIPYPIDREAAKKADFDVCFHVLVMLFFLHNLRRSSEASGFIDFAYDSAEKICDELARFLESDASMEVMRTGNFWGDADGMDGSTYIDPYESAAQRATQGRNGRAPHFTPGAQPPLSSQVGPWLQQQEQEDLEQGESPTELQVPPAGTIVQATNMATNGDLNGVQGTILGVENDRILVDFPPPHGAMLVLPQNLSVVAPPREPPPVGAQVRAVDIPTDLDGQVGLVTSHQVAADGMRVVVEFPAPHGTMLVRPGNLELVSKGSAGHVVGSAVEVLNAAALLGVDNTADLDALFGPGRRTLHGVVLEELPLEEGGMAYRVAAVLKGQIQEMPVLMQAFQLKALGVPGGEGAAAAAAASFDKDETERVHLDNMVLREQLELSKRNAAAKDERTKTLEAKLSHAGMSVMASTPASAFPEVDEQAVWKNAASKVRGEAFLTAMKFEIESLQRQVEMLERERAIARETHEEALVKMQLAVNTEKDMLERTHQSQVNLVDVRHRQEMAQLRSYFVTEVQNINAKIKYEETMMRQGLTGGTEELEEELLRLRQQKATHEPLVLAMEKTNASLRDLAVRHEQRASFEEQARVEVDEHTRTVLQSLLSPAGDGAPRPVETMAGGALPLQLLLDGQPLGEEGDLALRDALVRHVNSSLPPGAIVNEFLALALKVRQLHRDAAERTLEKDAQLEDLRMRASRAEREGTGGMAIGTQFEKDEEIARLQDQVARMRKTVDFMREKERKVRKDFESDPHEEHVAGDVVVPSHLVYHNIDGVSKSEASIDTICAHIRGLLHQKDWDGLNQCFWVLVANNSTLQHRIKRGGEVIKQLLRRRDVLAQEAHDEKATHEHQMAKYKATERAELEEQCMKAARERASVEVELKLTQEQLEQAQIQIREVPENLLSNAALLLQTDESRFKSLRRKTKSLKAALARSRMREDVLLALVQKQRELLQVAQALESSSDAQHVVSLQQVKHQLECEDNSLVEQFNQLPPLDDHTAVDTPEETDRIVTETIEATREQILAAQHNLSSFVECAESSTARIREMEVEKQSLHFAFTNERQARQQIKSDYEALLQEVAQLKRQKGRQDVSEDTERYHLAARIKQLEDDKQAVVMFQEIRRILDPSMSSDASLPAAVAPPAAHPIQPSPEPAFRAGAASAAQIPAAPPFVATPASTACTSTGLGLRAGSQGNLGAGIGRVGSQSAASAVPSLQLSGGVQKTDTHGLHSKINEARKQIERILAATKMDPLPVHAQQAKQGGAPASVPALPQPHVAYGGSLLDDQEFSRQRQRLLDGYTQATAPASAARPQNSAPGSVPRMWPDGQVVR